MTRSIALLSLLVGCDGDGDDTGDGDASFTVTAVIPASYGVHDGTDFSMAVVDDAGVVIDEGTGVIGTESSLAFTVPEGDGYDLHFWVDSNFSAGTAGACDFVAGAGSPDHMWSYPIGTVDADADFAIPAHNTTFQDVCATFE